MTPPRLLAALLLAAALAGCVSGDGDDAGDGDGTTTCTLAATGVPAHATPGENFSIDVQPTCDGDWTSDHVAAHFAASRSAVGDLAAYPMACEIHAQSSDDEHEEVVCTIEEEGTYFLRGHTIIDDGGGPVHVWTDEYVVIARTPEEQPLGQPVVLVYDVPSTAEAGAAFDIHVEVEWAVPPPGVQSDHLGGHFWYSPQENPSTSLPDTEACVHTEGSIPGAFDTSCTAEEVGVAYLRGHARFESGGQPSGETTDYWSEEVPVVIE